MARNSIGKESAAQTSATAGRAERPESTSGELDAGHAALSEVVQRLARDGHSGSKDIRHAAFAMQRIVGNQATARMLGSTAGDGGGRSVREVAHAGFQGGSSRLPYMARIQQSFGSHDIGGVRSFTGRGAAAASRALSAEAYTSGDRVVFADSAPSLRTAAHEAAHVVQQRAGIRLPGGIDTVGDRHERHADAVADQVVRGESAQRSLDAYFSAGSSGGSSSPARGGDAGVQRKFAGTLQQDVVAKHSAAKQTAARYATIIENLKTELEEHEHLTINEDAVLEAMIYRLENFDGDHEYSSYEHLIHALTSRGAILIDGQESGALQEPITTKQVVNLVLPGSGDRRWRTFAENMIGDGTATRKNVFKTTTEVTKQDPMRGKLGIKSGWKVFPTLYQSENSFAAGDTYMIRGPGTSNAVSSHPSNDIDSNLKTAKSIVEYYVKKYDADGVKVRILGHSRNGVVASLLARDLRSKYAELELDAVIFDPVPGADANARSSYNDSTLTKDPNKDQAMNSTVIYSLMDERWGFNPMHVYGAKRLILTHYSHHAGIEPGFRYNGRHLKGLGLLDLPPGIYVDERQTPGMPNLLTGPYWELEAVEPIVNNAKEEKGGGNKNRIARIFTIIGAFLKTKPVVSAE